METDSKPLSTVSETYDIIRGLLLVRHSYTSHEILCRVIVFLTLTMTTSFLFFPDIDVHSYGYTTTVAVAFKFSRSEEHSGAHVFRCKMQFVDLL